METAYFNTPLGLTKIMGNIDGIVVISIADGNEISNTIPIVLQEAILQLQQYFAGTRTDFSFKLNPKGTVFQKKVWQELLKIPFAKSCSYMDLSKKLGNPKAIRAVAAANGKNPLWIIVPCHRVIGSDGSLTGYAGGLWRKKWLLEHESPSAQLQLF